MSMFKDVFFSSYFFRNKEMSVIHVFFVLFIHAYIKLYNFDSFNAARLAKLLHVMF